MASKPNAIVAQSGGPTTVINASACGVIQQVIKSGKNSVPEFMRFKRKPLKKKLPNYI